MHIHSPIFQGPLIKKIRPKTLIVFALVRDEKKCPKSLKNVKKKNIFVLF